VPFNFTVQQSNGERMADQTAVTLTSLAPFTVTTPLSIGINSSSVTATGTPTGTGSGTVRIEANGTRFLDTTSGTVTVLPVAVASL
jgi:hypothetical protein